MRFGRLFIEKIFMLTVINIIFFCNFVEAALTQVESGIEFGSYVISPPASYWYYSKKFPQKIKKDGDFFLLTFCPNKNDFLTPPIPFFINLSVSNSSFEKFSDYYQNSQKYGDFYSDLPESIKTQLEIPGWNCKMIKQNYLGVECIALNEYLVTVALIGNDMEKVVEKIPVLKAMLLSFERIKE